jgi:hypothetical protein
LKIESNKSVSNVSLDSEGPDEHEHLLGVSLRWQAEGVMLQLQPFFVASTLQSQESSSVFPVYSLMMYLASTPGRKPISFDVMSLSYRDLTLVGNTNARSFPAWLRKNLLVAFSLLHLSLHPLD